ncbi:MAG: DUF2309 domain-containing protein [Myxococcales bacterium]|nr:DUF2309 domain-containing protein [Myxococcales bacterium]
MTARAAASTAVGAPALVAGAAIEAVMSRACSRIAPSWPLDRFIAVNPFWGLVDTPLPDVAAKLAALSGAELLMPRAWYRKEYREGRLRDEHLQAALDASESDLSLAGLQALLERDEPRTTVRARIVDVVDATLDLRSRPSWRSFIAHSVSQVCAAYFDDGQATFAPDRTGGLYVAWRSYARSDRSPALLLGATSYRAAAHELPETARELVETATRELRIRPADVESYFWGLLLDQNGWASWCAYRRWVARLEGRDDGAIVDLLAIRLAWERMLLHMGGDALARRWEVAMASWSRIDAAAASARAADWLLQAATEIAWREAVIRALPDGLRASRPAAVEAQAVFCIDVRSEVFRRALESVAPTIQTLGFAGFFGLPIEYQPLGASGARPQLPGLLAPRLRVADTGLPAPEADRQARRFDLARGFASFKADPLSAFAFVEALGLTYAAKLLGDTLGLRSPGGGQRAGSSRASAVHEPQLVGSVDGEALDLEARRDLAAGMLRGMSLTRDFARLVLLVGHGSTTCNNPHAAGLDCGACCGQTGEVNARVAASLLNDADVRQGLAERGIRIPDTTWFVAALHDTTTDAVELFELDLLPSSHQEDIERLRARLGEASARARDERAARLGLTQREPAALERAIRARTVDWAEVRPEWGLANNAAFLVAPREHCRHLDLGGRCFLHDYRHEEDPGYSVLELIMTAPMVVTHWINLQYYASTVDNLRYGSGDKVLHNVVGGHIGVFEGNGGDLRIGLPLQSLHDGKRWVHTPLRLSVFIEAPRAAIDGVLERHATVRDLVANGWLSLFQLDAEEAAVYALRGTRWSRQSGLAQSRGALTRR